MNDLDQTIYFKYHFYFKDKSEEHVIINLLLKDLGCIHSKMDLKPEWTKLEYNQCDNCKLNSDEHPYCPLALNLTDIIPKFKDKASYDKVFIRVETKDRIYERETSIQHGLSSLLGIIMVTSGCPNMQVLKPMVRFHLPFANVEETVFRSVSSYLLAQYFRYKKGLSPDWDLEGLLAAYKEVQIVNKGIAHRLVRTSEKDASTNAVVVLDVFAKELPFSILEGMKKIEYLYKFFEEDDN